jgi:hypothetical protein
LPHRYPPRCMSFKSASARIHWELVSHAVMAAFHTSRSGRPSDQWSQHKKPDRTHAVQTRHAQAKSWQGTAACSMSRSRASEISHCPPFWPHALMAAEPLISLSCTSENKQAHRYRKIE